MFMLKKHTYLFVMIILGASVINGAASSNQGTRRPYGTSFRSRMQVNKEYTALDQKQKRNPNGDYSKLVFAGEELENLDGLQDINVPKDKVISLYLNNNNIQHLKDPEVFKGFSNLKELHLENNPLGGDIEDKIFQHINRPGVQVTMTGSDIRSGTIRNLRHTYPSMAFFFDSDKKKTWTDLASSK